MLAHRFHYDDDRAPSLDIRVQVQGRPYIDLTGIVDSGASTSVLSKRHAAQLGLTPSDLRDGNPAIVADDSEVPCQNSIVPIRAQVLRQPTRGVLIPWGPTFNLHIAILDHATPLWGQDDFFATFRTTLARDADPSWFELIYQPDN